MLDNHPLHKHTVFVGGPFSSALKGETSGALSFQTDVRDALDRIHAMFALRGYGLFSSHLAEDYGRHIHEATLVQRDNAWLNASDLYVAVLPCGPSGPVRSDGTFVEIGLALGLQVPCVIIIENRHHADWSYYIRNLSREDGLLVLDMALPDDALIESIERYMAEVEQDRDRRTRIPLNVDVIHSLVSGGKAGHTIVSDGKVLNAPAGALTSRYCRSVAQLVRTCEALDKSRPVVEIGAGVGEITHILLNAGFDQVSVYEPDPALLGAHKANLSDRRESITYLETSPETENAIIVVQTPPFPKSGERDPFENRRRMIMAAMAPARHQAPHEWLIGVCDGAFADAASEALEAIGIPARAGLDYARETGVFRLRG